MKSIFEKLYQSQALTTAEMQRIARQMFEGQLSESQIAAFLTCLKIKGATKDEMAGLAQVMKEKAVTIEAAPTNAMDNCGTGGDFLNTFNISTTAAFILAGGGITMAKHGNRSISSRSGSADVLENLGIELAVNPKKIGYLLNEVGIAFLFAQQMHPEMRFVSKIRQDLATPTIFNLIGPLSNPIDLETQLMGTYSAELLADTAATLGQLGRKRAIVLHGALGMDEANLAGTTNYALYENGQVTETSFEPEEVGLPRYPLETIIGGDAAQNAQILLTVLQNERSPYLDTVLLNAGLGFYANGQVTSVKDGVDLARQVIASGAAYDKLRQLIREQQEVA